ncbi:MAG: hypothetical protein WB812_15340 [Woeseiaceae bacterium]|jgi:outer membrane lipoprotein SlyB
MRLISPIVLVCAAAGLAACAAHPDPIIDMKGVDQKQFTQDWNECAAYSREVDVARGAAKGAATGAAVGAVAGAIGGDVGESAAYGGLYGGTLSALGSDREQQMVFKRCMRGRGYRVLN